ncbi:N-6 DNA methylase [Catenulispora sp. NL8]|uniref:N-6 DNA methylase n=1 Tax=Catenulispora pinistramenti TaxID=2705254 RepID=A0ABS5KYC2_9ACTN|nr:N-6 DNA methylase [Catenulispora pinistramenti]MBS2551063.1 N-6 DNA methylase [Catenulispora pinistramenti]
MTDDAEVTAAQIARLAGVGRAAVSNWRKRHAGFPAPVGGSETSPTFSLAAVEQWLRAEGKLGETPAEELLWRAVDGTGGSGDATAAALGALGDFLGGGTSAMVDPEVARQATRLAEDGGRSAVFEGLLGRYLDMYARDLATGSVTVSLAKLMAALALPSAGRRPGPDPVTVYDPSCGSGSLLAAAARLLDGDSDPAAGDGSAVILLGETSDAALASLARTGLALLSPEAEVDIRAGEALLSDAFRDRAADAVLSQPPTNQRGWGVDTLAYDPRWEYGMPPRGEPELAWVQHALARLRPGGTAVLLLPPSVAARRPGRRVRAELLRHGALRAVVGLPPGSAAPHGLPMHLWILRRPDLSSPAPSRVLFVDESDAQRSGPTPSTRTSERIRDAWLSFDADPDAFTATPGLSAASPIIDLLDDAVDLSPARHVPHPDTGLGRAHLVHSRATVDSELARLGALLPDLGPEREPSAGPPWPMTTLADLARSGALAFVAEAVIEAGDVVVPLFGGAIGQADVVGAGDAMVGTVAARGVAVLRTDPTQLEAWFVAGFLRSDTAARQAVSHASTVSRMDVRKAPLPRLPLESQRAYAAAFRRVAEFTDALRLATGLGERLAQGVTDALAEGTVLPQA